MIKEYIQINQIVQTILYRALDAIDAHYFDNEDYVKSMVGSYIIKDVKNLDRLWPEGLPEELLDKLSECAKKDDFQGIIHSVIPNLQELIDNFFTSSKAEIVGSNIVDLLHPKIVQSSYAHLRNGHYRDAVFNAFIAVFDLIRERTKIDKDGAELIGDVFSLSNPKLIFSSLQTESGKNEQKGFLQILQGAYLGIRNPKAHSLESDLNEYKTIQYLMFASLLARRVEEAKKPKGQKR
jgi:uncharacterized protein (TIGR02391 family)